MASFKCRVLIVEDEALVALDLADQLREHGFEVVAIVGSLKKAMEAARHIECDTAVLDLNLAGQRIDPVADILADRRIPFVFATGYGVKGAPSRHSAVPVVGKPYDVAAVCKAVLACCRSEARS